MIRSSLSLRLLIPALVASGVFPEAVAQNRFFQKVEAQRAEVIPEASPGEEVTQRPKPEEGDFSADPTPLGVDVIQIRLVSHQDKTDPSPSPGSEKIDIDPELELPDSLASILDSYLGKEVSMALLAELGKDIIEAWRENNYPIVDVYYPEQNITGGKIQIVVREALFGKVEVEGAVHTKPEYLQENIRLSEGDRIDKRILESDLDWINENPIRQVNLIYERGELDGTSDIMLQTIEKDPFVSYLGFGNTGIKLTGENEWTAGFNWSNPFRTEQSVGYNFATDANFETITAHSAIYRAFLPWRHELRLLGSLVQSDVTIEDPFFPSDLNGESIQAIAEYRIPLPRVKRVPGLRHSFTAAIDYKTTNTDLFFGGVIALDSQLTIFQFRTEYEVAWPDLLGYTRLNLGLVWAPGNVLRGNDDETFDKLRAGATADYWYGFVEMERGFKLPADCQFVVRGNGHITDDRLNSTEQLIAGGYLTVRGFDENFIRGDSGAIVTAELISAPFSLLGSAVEGFKDQWNLVGFYDGGFMRISDPLPTEVSQSIQSSGIAMTCRLGESAFLRAAYGWVLDTSGVQEDRVEDGRFHFGVTVRY